MLVLLQNATTGRFYSGRNAWTDDPTLACHFRHVGLAINFALEQQLGTTCTNVIIDYPSPPCQLSIPVREDWRPDSLSFVLQPPRSSVEDLD